MNSGVSVGKVCFIGGKEVVAVAVATVVAWEAHADDVIIPSRRLNKKYFFMVENLHTLLGRTTDSEQLRTTVQQVNCKLHVNKCRASIF